MIAVLPTSAVTWREALRKDADWLRTDEGKRVVENVLFYQYPSGGWPKNTDMAAPLDEATREAFAQRRVEAIIDNGATFSQMRFLARAHAATGDEPAKAACLRGLQFLFDAQYDNGGWPMIYPLRKGYYTHITFNDGAMVGVLRLLRDVSAGAAPFEFVDADQRARASIAMAKGIDCILKCQVVVDGERTVWCAQHDEGTLAPASARSYELVSLSGQESVGVLEFLMSLDDPPPEIIAAVEAGVAWLKRSRIDGIRVERIRNADGRDRVAVSDPEAPPIWARFYEIGSNRPIFVGRDGVVRYRYAEIERERRMGYGYYGYWPAQLLEEKHPAWAKRWLEHGAN